MVDPERLEQANGNLWAAEIVLNNLAARPLAGALIAVSLAVPFAVDAVTAATAVLLLTAMRPRDVPPRPCPMVAVDSLRCEERSPRACAGYGTIDCCAPSRWC